MFFIWKALFKTFMLLILNRYISIIFGYYYHFALETEWLATVLIYFIEKLFFCILCKFPVILKTIKIFYMYKFYLNFKSQVLLDHNDIFSVLLEPCSYYLIFSVQSFTCFFSNISFILLSSFFPLTSLFHSYCNSTLRFEFWSTQHLKTFAKLFLVSYLSWTFFWYWLLMQG